MHIKSPYNAYNLKYNKHKRNDRQLDTALLCTSFP